MTFIVTNVSPVGFEPPRQRGSVIRPLLYLQATMAWGRFQKRFCALTPNFWALRPTLEKLFTGPNVGRRARKIGAGRKTVNEIDPGSTVIFFDFYAPHFSCFFLFTCHHYHRILLFFILEPI